MSGWKTLTTALAALFAGLPFARLTAYPVRFKSVQATFQRGSEESLRKTIDGFPSSPDGWSVAPKFDSQHSVIFVAEEAVAADLLSLTMFFMSGHPNTSFARFAVSCTTAANPDFESPWERLPVLNFGATAGDLMKGESASIQAGEMDVILKGTVPDNLYWISTRTRGKAITGFRIDVFPVFRSNGQGPMMSWAVSRDFILTEFKVEVISTTTNVALGAPVVASHPLFSAHSQQVAEALTDGWPATIAHPADGVPGKDFHFETIWARSGPSIISPCGNGGMISAAWTASA